MCVNFLELSVNCPQYNRNREFSAHLKAYSVGEFGILMQMSWNTKPSTVIKA